MVSNNTCRNSLEEEREKVVKEAVEELSKQHYAYESMLGNGTYGDVMKVYNKETDSYKAAKVIIHKNVIEKEIVLWSTLDHKNVLPLEKTLVLESKAIVFISPLLFKAFDEIITDPRFTEFPRSLLYVNKWLVDTLKGIEYMHAKQVCHLDLKLDNVLISKRGVARVCDFSFINGAVEPVIPEDVGLPTIYRPPEMFKRKKHKKMDGTKIDVWTYGILAVEAFTIQQLHRRLENCSWWNRDVKPVLKLMLEERIFEVLVKDSYPLHKFRVGEITEILDFIGEFLRLIPSKRIAASASLKHCFVRRSENVEVNLENIFSGEELWSVSDDETSKGMINIRQILMNARIQNYKWSADSFTNLSNDSSSRENEVESWSVPSSPDEDEVQSGSVPSCPEENEVESISVPSCPDDNESNDPVVELARVKGGPLLPQVTKKKLKHPKVKIVITSPLRCKPIVNGTQFYYYNNKNEEERSEEVLSLRTIKDSIQVAPVLPEDVHSHVVIGTETNLERDVQK